MCGRIVQKSGVAGLSIVEATETRAGEGGNIPPRYNGAPGQDLLVIRRNPASGEVSMSPLRWGLIPSWMQDARGGPKPINARAETVRRLPMFREAYAKRRCIVPVDAFFEWHASGKPRKQAYAIGLKSGAPFGLAALWENWKDPNGEWQRTFAIVTCEANELMREIHERMPVILQPDDYVRWLSDAPEADDLLRPFPASLMKMWRVGARVNSVRNDDAALMEEEAEEEAAAQ
ncbi:MAG TPA: SOS response-associated peptidase [Xanthobacteraceae bacterium]|nr:SOS response-associated peptidase [Xanthobacteraceae bacterium]